MKRDYIRLILVTGLSVICLTLLFGYAFMCSFVYLNPSLPSAASMRNVEFRVPLRVYSRSGQLIAQIGEQRRIPVSYDQIPVLVREAFIAAEDDRFFQHHGVDYPGVLRALFVNLLAGDRAQGASTITQQAARNMFLTLDKTWRRKLAEFFVTYRMEHEFTKPEILSLYLNVIFFGQRSYGVAAAAESYFGKSLDQLDVAETATLAGIPQAPSRYNPLTSPELAAARRSYVLRRMRELGFIDPATAEQAKVEPINAHVHTPVTGVDAPYIAEMARLEVRRRFGPAAEDEGYSVYTTIDARLQAAANRAVHLGLIEYDRRHGWRGAQSHVDLEKGEQPADLEDLLDEFPTVGGLAPAVVVAVADKSARIYVKTLGFAPLDWGALSWARRKLPDGERVGPEPKTAGEVLTRGDVVYVLAGAVAGQMKAELAQVPEAQSALVALDPNDGAVAALVGGFDYFANKYNRAVQARRQPGSGFKPFLYSAALEDGFTPASIVMDAPIVLDDPGMEEVWRPENSSKEFNGPTRVREALVHSRNLCTIRILRQMGMQFPSDYVTRFGFDERTLPRNLTLALGTLQTTPLEIASGYAVFANGGYRIEPYFIDRIVNAAGNAVFEAAPKVVCEACNGPALPPPDPPAAAGAAPGAPSSGAASGAALAASTSVPEGTAAATPATGAEAAAPQSPEHPLGPPPPAAAVSAGPAPTPAPQADDAPPALRALAALRGLPDWPLDRVATRVISPQNAWLMDDMMREVITRGTGVRARALGRSDLAGKTGTTNEDKDAWFNGFNRGLVASVWVGYDQERPLGVGEEGARTAVPVWVYFMREALKYVPDHPRPMPEGLVQERISPTTGQIVSAEDPAAISETFMAGRLPSAVPGEGPGGGTSATSDTSGGGEPIF